MLGQVEDGVVRFGGSGVFEQGRFLAMGMAAAAVVADFAGPKLVPGLCHVQDHAVLVERLESERHVGGNLGEEAGIWVAVGIGRLPSGG